ncbi:MAG: FHA domain-containing protein [Chloroflexota bacterium]|nr:FHA domain-containing protein [Chloroflexota bacterium]
MTTYLDVYGSAGNFLPGLTSEDITLTENGNSLPILELEELKPGAQVVVGINVSPPFAIRDDLGYSRFERLAQALIEWGTNLTPENTDDLSLITNDGIEKTHLSSPHIWVSTLETYAPKLRETASNLNVLAHAIDIASDSLPQQAMKRIVLFITASPTPEEVAALLSLTARAQEHEVRVFIWLISSPAFFDSSGAQQLRVTAEETGGTFFAFSGAEVMPSLEDYAAPLRGTYRLTYQSQIASEGTHTLGATIQTPAGRIATTTEFQLDIQPPNPIFIAPPLTITRENPNPENKNAKIETYTPVSQEISAIIEFPDGHPRPLEETILYVDGSVEARNTNAPFDEFTWNIGQYEESETHHLEIYARDNLGLSRTSVAAQIQVVVDKPAIKIEALRKANKVFEEYQVTIIALGFVIVVAVVFLILLRRGSIHPKAFLRNRKSSLAAKGEEDAPEEEVAPAARESISSWINRFAWPKEGETARQASATLEPITEQAQKLFPEPLSVYNAEETFGKDASAATILIKEPSVDNLHARLEFISENTFKLSDEGSVAGTWLNYQPIGEEGDILQHGDTIHIGRVGFLFHIQDESAHQEVIITSEEHIP